MGAQIYGRNQIIVILFYMSFITISVAPIRASNFYNAEYSTTKVTYCFHLEKKTRCSLLLHEEPYVVKPCTWR